MIYLKRLFGEFGYAELLDKSDFFHPRMAVKSGIFLEIVCG